MSEAREPLRRVVVAGDGQVGLLAAIAIRRALPRCEVLILPVPADGAAFANLAATSLPFTVELHERLGISEEAIVRRVGGSHRLLTRLLGFGDGDRPATMTYGAAVDAAANTRFARDWGGGRPPPFSQGAADPLAEALVDTGRFAVAPPDTPTPISGVDYAMRWNPAAYRGLLIEIARQMRIGSVGGKVAGFEKDGENELAAIIIEGQGRLQADLFVDCSGPGSFLLSALPGCIDDDWSGVLPPVHVHMSAPGQPMLALEDRLSLLPEGWFSELAGRDGLQCALGTSADLSPAQVSSILGGPAHSSVSIKPGRRRDAWVGNVVAIGDAAARFGPLLGLPLDLAHRQLGLLLDMLPGSTIEPAERAEFNRRSGLMADAVRDTLSLIYASPRATGRFAPATPSDRVAQTIDQFRRRGRVIAWEEPPFLKQELAMLIEALSFEKGEGLPDDVDAGQAQAMGRDLEQRLRSAIAYAPPYAQWMAGVMAGSIERHPA